MINSIAKIAEVGEAGFLSDEDVKYFLPNKKLQGSEIIKIIYHSDALFRFANSESNYINLIKGFHLIELKYNELNKSTHGFGSPTVTYELLRRFSKINFELAKELENWINGTGGNYYMPRNKLLSENDIKIADQELKNSERIRVLNRQKKIDKNQLKFRKTKEKQKLNKSERDKLLEIEISKVLEEIINSNKSIFFYADCLIKRKQEILDTAESLELWEKILEINANRKDQEYQKLIKIMSC